MRTRFDEQLGVLKAELGEMGRYCEAAISLSIKALTESDEALRKNVFDVAESITQKAREVETVCTKLLLQQQPVARDLRLISAAMKMIYDMERIGTLAGDIAEISQYVKYSLLENEIHLKEMTVEAIKMVSESVNSFITSDLELAHQVISYDDVVDDLFVRIKGELVDIIASRRENSECCIDLLMIAKYLEKIGDHAVNVAEWVHYSITGTHMDT
ncbi:MAG: phosphate signaling complex protein PhoU [Clostridia bacterium]|nr:phosphate signaling complex protein PhoU [Clostridia bacterium]